MGPKRIISQLFDPRRFLAPCPNFGVHYTTPLFLFVCVSIVSMTPPAEAQPTHTSHVDPKKPATITDRTSVSYAHYVVGADALGLIIGGISGNDKAFLAMYGLGGPLVHVAKGNMGRAALSLGARVALPLVVGGVLSEGCGDPDPDPDGTLCEDGRRIVGTIIGGILAVGIDWIVLSKEHKRKKGAPSLAPKPRPATVRPAVSLLPRGTPTLGIEGSF